jgi:hypothetical protein
MSNFRVTFYDNSPDDKHTATGKQIPEGCWLESSDAIRLVWLVQWDGTVLGLKTRTEKK